MGRSLGTTLGRNPGNNSHLRDGHVVAAVRPRRPTPGDTSVLSTVSAGGIRETGPRSENLSASITVGAAAEADRRCSGTGPTSRRPRDRRSRSPLRCRPCWVWTTSRASCPATARSRPSWPGASHPTSPVRGVAWSPTRSAASSTTAAPDTDLLPTCATTSSRVTAPAGSRVAAGPRVDANSTMSSPMPTADPLMPTAWSPSAAAITT